MSYLETWYNQWFKHLSVFPVCFSFEWQFVDFKKEFLSFIVDGFTILKLNVDVWFLKTALALIHPGRWICTFWLITGRFTKENNLVKP